MQDQRASGAVRAFADVFAARTPPRNAAEIAERRARLEAAVDELKAAGLTPEAVLLEVKQVWEERGATSSLSAGWTEIVNWILTRYFATHARSDANG